MKLLDIKECLEDEGFIEVKDVEELLEEERLLTVNAIISFIKEVQSSVQNEEDKKIINKLLLNIEDEFKESES